MLQKVCDHFLNLKTQKIANSIQKCSTHCKLSEKHCQKEMAVCLHCGDLHCDGDFQKSCAYQHYFSNHHSVILRIHAKELYCFACARKVLDQNNSIISEDKNYQEKLTKTIELADKVLTYFENNAIRILQDLKLQSHNEGKIVDYKISKESKEKEKQEKGKEKGCNFKEKEEKNKTAKKNELRVFGLSNIGNTCFFNSILQCLYATQAYHAKYKQMKFSQKIKGSQNLGKSHFSEINIIFKKFIGNCDKVYCPKSLFYAACKGKGIYKNMDQQDAQQLLNNLLNQLIEGEKQHMRSTLNVFELKELTVTEQIFQFILASRLHCFACGKVSWNFQRGLDLSVGITKSPLKKIECPENQEVPQAQIEQPGLFYPQSNANDACFLDSFFSAEILGSSNYFKCSKCHANKAVRKFYMRSQPSVLVVVLKRFNNNGEKIHLSAKVAEHISLGNYMLVKGLRPTYDLYGLVVHNGSSRGGHYISYTRRHHEWYYFSDSHCKPFASNKIKSLQPYLAFYRRNDL